MDNLVSRLAGALTRTRNATPVPFTTSQGMSLFSNGSGELPIGDAAFNAYGSMGTLFAIVSQIGNAFARTPWHLYRKSAQREKTRRKEVLIHPFLTVWNRPNQFMTGRAFREAAQQHLDLVGETDIVLYREMGMITEMWPVRPDRMVPVKHPTEFMTGWIYIGPNGEEVPLALEDVIQIKLPNPADPYRGIGPVQTVLMDIDSARYSADWNRNFFINGARPGGIIKVDYKMSDSEFNTFTKRWKQQHQGVSNAHRVALLENAEWVDTAFSMNDMQFVELRNLPRELIREAFAFPKPMLGTVDDVNRANAEAGKEIMAEGQTIPRLDRWKDIINVFLLPQFINGAALEADYEDPTPINQEAQNATYVAASNAAKNLVLAGYDPTGVAEYVGMPEIDWVGIPAPVMAAQGAPGTPAPATPAPSEESEEGDEEESDPAADAAIQTLLKSWK